jgi:GAF domain-containing protein
MAELEPTALRTIPITHAGEVLGLIVIERPDAACGGKEEQLLEGFAREVGLALTGIRLGEPPESKR